MRGEIDPATLDELGGTQKPRVSFVQHMVALLVIAAMFWLAFGKGSPFADEGSASRAVPDSAATVAQPRPTVAASSPAISLESFRNIPGTKMYFLNRAPPIFF